MEEDVGAAATAGGVEVYESIRVGETGRKFGDEPDEG